MVLVLLSSVCSAHALGIDLKSLEVDSVLRHLASHARTVPGKRFCETLPLASSPAECREAYAAVGEALDLESKEWPQRNNPLALVPILEELRRDGSVGIRWSEHRRLQH